MPIVNGKLVTADEALAQGLCPECGASFKDENAIAHRNAHWQAPIPVDKRGDEPRRRRALLDEYIAKENVRTTNMPAPAAAKPAELP